MPPHSLENNKAKITKHALVYSCTYVYSLRTDVREKGRRNNHFCTTPPRLYEHPVHAYVVYMRGVRYTVHQRRKNIYRSNARSLAWRAKITGTYIVRALVH